MAAPSTSIPAESGLDAIYLRSADYVWFTLQRLGVREADLEDLSQDVFLIAHRKLASFDGRVKINAWLFGICLRVAANYRRRAHIRLERATGSMDQDDAPTLSAPASERPDRALERRQAQDMAEAILGRMELVKRAVFVMFEIEGMSCQEIADEVGVPLGTVYSRLHAARKFFAEAAARSAGTKTSK